MRPKKVPLDWGRGPRSQCLDGCFLFATVAPASTKQRLLPCSNAVSAFACRSVAFCLGRLFSSILFARPRALGLVQRTALRVLSNALV